MTLMKQNSLIRKMKTDVSSYLTIRPFSFAPCMVAALFQFVVDTVLSVATLRRHFCVRRKPGAVFGKGNTFIFFKDSREIIIIIIANAFQKLAYRQAALGKQFF